LQKGAEEAKPTRDSILPELDRGMRNARKTLDRIPDDNRDGKANDISESGAAWPAERFSIYALPQMKAGRSCYAHEVCG
jgi:hypothetical protein